MTDEARTAQPMTAVFVEVSGIKIKDGDSSALQFTVTLPLRMGADSNLDDLLHVVKARRAGGALLTLRLAQAVLPETQPELPMDGVIPEDPFPAWEKLFDAAEMPLCECPDPEEGALAYPRAVWVTDTEGSTVEIAHVDPCKLQNVKVSTLDYNDTEDFNRAIVKARGLKPIPLEPEPEADEGMHDAGDN